MVSPVAEVGIDSMPIELAILEADGTIVLVNDAWRRFGDENHGTDPDHWVDENYFAVLERAYEEPLATEALDGLESLLAGTADRFEMEYPCHSPDRQRWFKLDATGFARDGEPYLFVCHYDVTERKLAERRADARTKQLETVIQVLAHDLRNPLQVIDGYTELVAAELDDVEEIERIRTAVARISEITEATLHFSETGTLSPVEPVSLSAIAADAWAGVPTADATLAVRESKTFHGDRRLLLQLFENLFRNAVEHGGHDCTVTVGALPEGFYVEDTGPGIPAEIREKALDADFSTQGTGGLGLAIVQAVVQAHGAELRIADADGGGARFEITEFDVAP